MIVRPLLWITALVSLCLAVNMAAQDAPSKESARSIRTDFTCQSTIGAPPPGTKRLALWLPLPSDSAWQKVEQVTVEGAPGYKITQEPRYHNRMIYVQFHAPTKPTVVTLRFRVFRTELKVLGAALPAKVERATPTFLKTNLAAEKNLPVGGRFLGISNQVTAGKLTTMEKARSLYDHALRTLSYDYKGESPKLSAGDAEFVCDYKRGDCTDLHSYLISLARSQGIPIIHEYGFGVTGVPPVDPLPVQAKITSFHCYTRFYDPSHGWVPMDASDGIRWQDLKRKDMSDFHFGNVLLERNAVVMSQGRNLVLAPPQKGAPVNNFIYPYAEADGQPVKVALDLSRTIVDPPERSFRSR